MIIGGMKGWVVQDTKFLVALFYALLFLSFIGFSPFSIQSEVAVLEDTGVSSMLRQVGFISIFLCTIFYLPRIVWSEAFAYRWPIYLLLIFSVVSILWSYLPDYTLRRSILFFVLLSSVFIFTSLLRGSVVLLALYRFLTFSILVSIVSVLFVAGAKHSGVGVVDEALVGSWKGVFSHKNQAAPIAYVLLCLSLYYYLLERDRTHLVVGLSSLVFMFGAYSKTTLILLVPVLLGALLVCRFRQSVFVRMCFWLFVVMHLSAVASVFCGAVFFDYTYVFEDASVTGRGSIWNVVLSAIADNPVLGMGYGSVWLVGENMPIQSYVNGFSEWIYLVGHSHNGYLESFVSLGVLGVILSLLFFLVVPGYMIIYRNDLGAREQFLFASFWMFFWLHNLVETDVLNSSDPRWVLVIVMYFIVTGVKVEGYGRS